MSSFLKMGVTFLAYFQEEGKYPSEREWLAMTAYGFAKMFEPSFNRQVLKGSGPQALLLSRRRKTSRKS